MSSSFPDYYKVLEVKPGANESDIRQAYKVGDEYPSAVREQQLICACRKQKQSLIHHPDRLKNPTEKERVSATEKFQTVADACSWALSRYTEVPRTVTVVLHTFQTMYYQIRPGVEPMTISEPLTKRCREDIQQTTAARPVPISSIPSSAREDRGMRTRTRTQRLVQAARAPDRTLIS